MVSGFHWGPWGGQCVEEQNLFFLFLMVALREQEQVKEEKREVGRKGGRGKDPKGIRDPRAQDSNSPFRAIQWLR